MSMLITTKAGGPQSGIPVAIPYTSIDRIEVEDINGDYTLVVYTLTGERVLIKKKFSFNRSHELMKYIATCMEKGAKIVLTDESGPDFS